MAEVLQLCSYPVVVSPDAPPGVFGLLSIQMASIRPGGRPHGSGMVFALLAFCGVFAAPATMFPKDKRMFSSSHDRNVDRVQAVARRFTLSTKLIVTSLFRICLSRYGALS